MSAFPQSPLDAVLGGFAPAGRVTYSFEFFPPKTAAMETQLWGAIKRLEPLEPKFVSVTYGAGGTTRERTHATVRRIHTQTAMTAAAHLTCVGAPRSEIDQIAQAYWDAGVRSIVALRGDPPEGAAGYAPHPGGYDYAADLVAGLRRVGDFDISVAAFPEVHPEAADAVRDLEHLRGKVEAGADFLISQLFFDNRKFFAFEASARDAGIAVPILAGIMPVTNVSQIQRFSQMCGATMPEPLARRLHEVDGDPQEVFWTGVSYAAHQCRGLLRPPGGGAFERAPAGVAGIHFYTLNKSPSARAIFEILRLARVGI